MPTIAIISQKGGAGKTTLALHLAAAAEDAGHTALVIDLDPQATASQWAAWRKDAPPVVIDSAPPRLAAQIEQARAQGAAFIVIATPPHADSAARATCGSPAASPATNRGERSRSPGSRKIAARVAAGSCPANSARRTCAASRLSPRASAGAVPSRSTNCRHWIRAKACPPTGRRNTVARRSS